MANREVAKKIRTQIYFLKKLEIFGEHLLSEDDHSHWAPPYWNIMIETFSLVELKSKSNY